MQTVIGLGLNVWTEDHGWRMTIYPDTPDGTDSSQYISLDPTREQIDRYLEISQDDDWWVYDKHPDFAYILWGTR